MKVLYLLLIPCLIYSNNYSNSDTLFLKSGQVYPCIIYELDQNLVHINYKTNAKRTVAINILNKIFIGDIGCVYDGETGFSMTLDSLQEKLSYRKENPKTEEVNVEPIKEQEIDNVNAQDILSIRKYFSVRYGHSGLISVSKFISAYNNPDAFIRPNYPTNEKWQEYQPFESTNTFTIEFGLMVNNDINVGISYESININNTDNFSYSGVVSFDQNNNPIFFDVDESYSFETKFTPIMAFFNYRILTNSIIYPEVGFGVGLGLTKFKWSWKIYAERFISNVLYYTKNDRVWFEEEEKKFIFQPKLRINLNISKLDEGIGKYFDSLYLQFDYIHCTSEYDIFKNYREEILYYINEDEIPPNYRKTLFQKYDVDWGGFQIKLGILIKTF